MKAHEPLSDTDLTAAAQQQQKKNRTFADMGTSPYGANQGWASYRAGLAEVVASWVPPASPSRAPRCTTCVKVSYSCPL